MLFSYDNFQNTNSSTYILNSSNLFYQQSSSNSSAFTNENLLNVTDTSSEVNDGSSENRNVNDLSGKFFFFFCNIFYRNS